MPHSAFEGQTPDEKYRGRVAHVADELAARRHAARQQRVASDRSVAMLSVSTRRTAARWRCGGVTLLPLDAVASRYVQSVCRWAGAVGSTGAVKDGDRAQRQSLSPPTAIFSVKGLEWLTVSAPHCVRTQILPAIFSSFTRAEKVAVRVSNTQALPGSSGGLDLVHT